MSPNLLMLLIVALYMAVLLVLGLVASRMTRSPEDFFLAGRKLGPWVVAVSSTASSESGWVTLGAVGMAYTGGVSALWFAPGCLCGYIVNLYFVAPRLRRQSKECGSLTLPGFLADRLGDPLHLVRIVGVIVIFLSLATYVAANMTALGKVVNALLELPQGWTILGAADIDGDGLLNFSYGWGVFIGGIIVVAYSLLGGFRAVCWTDLLQGAIMVFALVVMPILVIIELGGYSAMLQALADIDPNLVTVTGGKTGFALFGLVVGLFGIGLGYPGQPHVLTRYMAASSDEKVRQIQLIAMVWGVLVFWGACFLGLAGRLLEPGLKDPEQLFPILAEKMLHPVMAGIMLAAILSAIMSTISSQLLVAASAVSRDLFEKVFDVAKSERASVLLGRASVLVLGIAAVLVALGDVRMVFWFVLFAWSGLGAAFGPVVLLALLTRILTWKGAVAGMVTGFLVTIVWKLTGLSDSVIYELVPAFFLAGAAATLVSLLDPSKPDAKESSAA